MRFPVQLQERIASNPIIRSFDTKVNRKIADVTQSQQFKRWFGDWQNHPESASKAVNADGTPMVVYHGTNTEFWTFDLAKSGRNYGETSEGLFFFTNKRNGYSDSAEDYARAAAQDGGTPRIMECYLSMKKPLVLHSDGYYTPTAYFDKNAEAVYKQYLNGDYDGIIIENSDKSVDDSVIYLLDNPTQIKSATDNIGTFDGSNPDIRYSFRNTKSGMANDSLKPYSAELTDIITGNGDFIVDSFDALIDVVNLAFDEPTKKATAYFGNLDVSILEKIKSSIPDLPSEYRQEGMLFKKGMDYSVAATLDNIRHLIDEKGLSKADVIDYLDRLADTIADFDTVNFSYYMENRVDKQPGLRFKKTFSDGTFVSFEIPSKKRTRLSMQTMFLERADYKKRKSAEPLLMQNAPAYTPEVRGGQTSGNSIAHGSQDVKTSIRNKSNRELLSEALETTIDTSTPMGQYEAKLLGQYRENVERLDGLQAHLKDVNAEIRALTFGDAPRDPARLRALKDEKIKTENRIGIYDKKLLRLEATQPLKDVLEREKKQLKQEMVTAFRESTKAQKAQSETRGKLKRVIKSLDQLLNHGTKERNVKADMQETVGAVLSLGQPKATAPYMLFALKSTDMS